MLGRDRKRELQRLIVPGPAAVVERGAEAAYRPLQSETVLGERSMVSGVRFGRLIHTVTLVVVAALIAPTVDSAPASPESTISFDGPVSGEEFAGVGGISAGASSRLLYDYPEPARSQLLDYLFTPGYGASLQVLKVEIGADTNSTDGSEASHSRARGQVDCDLGYEWWLMAEAKKRNPAIKLYGLEWGAPGWFDGGFWSQDNIDYLQSWLGCADRHGLRIDYLGGWNESGYDADWFIALDRALARTHPHIEIVAADEYESWSVATAVRQNPAFAAAVDIVGSHDPCDARTQYQYCPSSPDARALGKPLWDSETSSQAHDVGAGPIARSLNRDYLDGGMTGHLYWTPISAWYATLPIADTGAMLAEWPWSGHYRIGSSTWALAHTAQFVRPGWQYVPDSTGYLPNGASRVTRRSPDTGDVASVIETMDATRPITVRVDIGALPGPLHLWSSNLASPQGSDDFVHVGDLSGPSADVTLHPGHLYTLGTLDGHKGTAGPSAGIGERMRLPFREDFEQLPPRRLARFFSDVDGGFQTEPCRGGRAGQCYGQQVRTEPVAWNDRSNPPSTLVGDPRWWGDYEVSADASLDGARHVEVWGRIESNQLGAPSGYRLRFDADGRWQLVSSVGTGTATGTGVHGQCSSCGPRPPVRETTLAAGQRPLSQQPWHRLALRMLGDRITVLIDGNPVATVRDSAHTVGQAGLAVSGWDPAQFDDVAVTRTGPAPSFYPQDTLRANATSAHGDNFMGYTFGAERAVDDRPETIWHSEFDPPAPLPQSLTVDLGQVGDVSGLAYSPHLQSENARVSRYAISTSTDGVVFTPAGHGAFPTGTATRLVSWPVRAARYVRFDVIESTNGFAAASEIRIMRPSG